MRAFRFGPALLLAAAVLLSGNTADAGDGGPALDRTQTNLLSRSYDQQLRVALETMIASAEIDTDGKIWFSGALGDQRFLESKSGYYWQVSAEGKDDLRSRSLWERRLKVSGRTASTEPLYYDSDQFPDEPLRIVEQTIRLAGSDVEWQFVVARVRDGEAS